MTQNTLLHAATTFEKKSTKTKNIAEIPGGIVDLSLPVEDDQYTDKATGEVRRYKVIIFEGDKYRVPVPVLEQIKQVVQMGLDFGKPVTKVRITREGKTQTDTKYIVGAYWDKK